MTSVERRRSARHLLGVSAEVHIGPSTVTGVVHDVSQHGMGLILPSDIKVQAGDVLWILASSVASYAITATVQRITESGVVGVQFEEVLSGEALDVIEALPLTDELPSTLTEETGP